MPWRRGASDAWLATAAVLLVVAPLAVVLVEALAHGYAPTGDRAVVAIRAHDVLTRHPPLVGAYSTSSVLTGTDTFSPGPLLYWWLALPSRLPGFWALPTAIAVLNGACAAGTVLLARRRGGAQLMVAVAVCVVVLLSSLPTDLPNDIWAPSAPVLPVMLLVAVCWSIACGDAFLLPLAAFLTSFVSQAHLAYLLPSVLILGIACAGLVVAVRHDRQGVGGRSGHPVRRWVLLGACVMVVCWSLPGLDQALGWAGRDGHGNLGHIVDAAGVRGKTAGLDAGVHALVSAVGVPPWWLRTLPPPQMKTFEIFGASSAVARITALGWLLALAAALIAGWRRGRQDVVTACAIAGSLCLAIVAFTASFPNRGGLILSYSYSSWWEVPAGMWVWVLVTWSVVSLLPLRRPAQLTTRAAYALGMVGAALLLGLLGFRTRDHAVNPNEYRPSGSLIAQIREHAPRDEPVQVVGHTFGFDSSAVYALRLEGLDVGSSDARELGRPYATEGRRFAQIVEITEGDRPPSPKARVIARVPLQGTPPRTITALLRPGD